ncbi:MAG: peptide/nickel transport system substrate-binding protein [Thermomicrobiales bacterium]|nr:peptide/nickel transport system substrate-binding protein [Thermomicrobiales bacterium]
MTRACARVRMGTLRGALLLVVFGLIAMPGGLLAKQASPEAAGGGTLIGGFDVGPGGCPECFNPLQATAGFTWLEKYYSKLMLYDVDFTAIQGELAESWEISADATQYTIKLRPGVTWHDGQRFTSADVKFTIELAKNPDSASYIGAKFSGVTAIETPDDLTVVITLGAPNAAVLDAFTFLVMLPKHALEAIAPADLVQSDWWRTNPIGTGPFKWSQHKPGEYVELVAYDDYWRGRPKLDKIINRFFPEAGSSVIALRSGEIQFTYLSTDEALALEGNPDITVLSGPSQVVNVLGFDMTDPRFQDVRVRQAFMYAIDRQAIVDQLYQGQATLVPCAYVLDKYLPADANAYAPDPEMARSLLQEAGWDSSKPVEEVTYYTDQLSTDVLVTIQQMLADVGVTLDLRAVDVPTYNQIMGAPDDWDVTYAGAANGPDPDVMSTHFESKAQNPTALNRSNISDPELDRLFVEGRQATDADQRAQIYQQVCKVMNEQVYWAPMWVTTRFGGASTKIGNFVWTPAPGGGRFYDAAESWTIAA